MFDGDKDALEFAALHGFKLVVAPVTNLNSWAIVKGVGVEGHVGQAVVGRMLNRGATPMPQYNLVQGEIIKIGTDGGSEVAVAWHNGGTSGNMRAGKFHGWDLFVPT
jgi:hypothetical protein